MSKVVHVIALTPGDAAKLHAAKVSQDGGSQGLLSRLRDGIHAQHTKLAISEEDLVRLNDLRSRWWHGYRGGWQRRLPMESLRRSGLLDSRAPLFQQLEESKGRVPVAPPQTVYFEWAEENNRIKIGKARTLSKRRRKGYRTDSPEYLQLLLAMLEEPGRTERDYHARFADERIWPHLEWFHPSPRLLGFIRAESAKQELLQRRPGDDAAPAGEADRGSAATAGDDSGTLRGHRRVRGRVS